MKKFYLFLIILVLIVLGIILYTNKSNIEKDIVVETPKKEVTNNVVEEKDISFSEMVIENPNTKIANLIDVSGGTSSGKGYVLREDGRLYHYVFSDLPDPSGTNKYEGWLVQQQPALKFFSTGVMEKVIGGYELTFEKNEESAGYDFVVITEETVIDETPEKHIIEGMAK